MVRGLSSIAVEENADLVELMSAIASDRDRAVILLADSPRLAPVALAKARAGEASDEFFLEECRMQVYAGDTALHIAAAAYDVEMARKLVAAHADVRAKDRRGAEPLHSAIRGGPGSSSWDPSRQTAVISYLIEAGADVDAAAAGGVTPLHRAVRNRCSAAVRILLDAGADPLRASDSGSTAVALTQWTTGRGGTGSPEARSELQLIAGMLGPHTGEQDTT
jgi:ankyrin repeat protein